MTKREFLLQWASKEDVLTTYPMHPYVGRYGDIFYPKSRDKKPARSLSYELSKLVKEKILEKPHYVALGFDSMIELGCRVQWFYTVNPKKLREAIDKESENG